MKIATEPRDEAKAGTNSWVSSLVKIGCYIRGNSSLLRCNICTLLWGKITYLDVIIGAISMLIVSTVQPNTGSRLSHSIIPVTLVSTGIILLGFSTGPPFNMGLWCEYRSSNVIWSKIQHKNLCYSELTGQFKCERASCVNANMALH